MIRMQLLHWRGERKATITQRLRFASRATPGATLGLVYAHEAGLEPEEVARARRVYGDNSVPVSGMGTSPARRLVEALLNPFVGVLALLAAVSFGCSMVRRSNGLFAAEGGDGMPVTVGVILVMVAVSVVIRYVHSSRSSHAVRALSHLVDTTALVRRVGAGERRIPADELVVGDIVLLAPGDTVPADCKLLDSRDLRVVQSFLTGESMPVRKDAGLPLDADDRTTALTDAPSLVFMGTTVISGFATALVIATGRHAMFGGLSRSLSGRRARTRFEHGMNSTSWMLMAFTAVTVPVAMLVTGLAGGDWMQALLSGVAVAVGLTPEALPLIVTVCLATGARAMATGRVIVKRLDAMETLGGMDVLCVDKTGTLTDESSTFADCPKADAESTIARLRYAGIRVIMLTGDEEREARTVAREVGVNAGRVVVGRQLDDMGDSELTIELDHAAVFAKLSPMHKARIVSLLRREGHCVGYMGDGVNDMPAMQASEIAVSAGTGSDAVREAADVLLTRQDLGVLLKGVTASRRTHVNIMKYLKLALSSNFGNIISVILAGAFLPFVPMAPVQMMLLNILYDLTCLTIPFDRVDDGALRRPARWDTPSIARFMACFGPISSVFDMVTFAVMFAIICPAAAGGPFFGPHDAGMQASFIAMFQSGWFIISMWTQITALNLLRTERVPFVDDRAAAPLARASLAVLLLVTMLPFTPVGALAGFHALPGVFFLLLAAVIVGYAILVLVVKHLYLRRTRPLL